MKSKLAHDLVKTIALSKADALLATNTHYRYNAATEHRNAVFAELYQKYGADPALHTINLDTGEFTLIEKT
jgi:hypothetical protein